MRPTKAEMQAAFAMIEDLMGRLYTDAPLTDHAALAQYTYDALDVTDGKRCRGCPEMIEDGEPFVIGPFGTLFHPGCAGHIGCGCRSDPLFQAVGDDERCHQTPSPR